MENLKHYKYIILMILIILGFSFYWYSYRPTKIKEGCSADVHSKQTNKLDLSAFGEKSRQEKINIDYNDCLMRFGLK